MKPSHIPVLTGEVVENLQLRPSGVVIDATVGEGGHSQVMARVLGPRGTIIGIDKDIHAIASARKNLSSRKSNGQFIAIRGSYTTLGSVAQNHGYQRVDAILFDLGLSSLQLTAARGFSFQQSAPLDMRFDEAQGLTAEEIVNSASRDELSDIFWRFGEERASYRVAKAIFEARQKQRITTTDELVKIIARAKGKSAGRLHSATLIFQALRIAVNRELEELSEALPEAIELLKRGGRLAVISYHSLEDRIVKHLFREAARAGKVKLITKKPVRPSHKEVASNPRARSAKLRVLEKL